MCTSALSIIASKPHIMSYSGFLLNLRALVLPVESSHGFAQLVTCEHHGLLKGNGTDYGTVAMFLAMAVGYDAHVKMEYTYSYRFPCMMVVNHNKDTIKVSKIISTLIAYRKYGLENTCVASKPHITGSGFLLNLRALHLPVESSHSFAQLEFPQRA